MMPEGAQRLIDAALVYVYGPTSVAMHKLIEAADAYRAANDVPLPEPQE